MTLRHYWVPTLDAYLKCSFEIPDKVGLLDKTLNTSLMAFFIHKFLSNLSYVRHTRLTFYARRRTILNFSACDFQECVSKVMAVSKKTHLALLPITLAVSSLIRHKVISSWINGRFTGLITSLLNEVFGVFNLRRGDSTWPKPNHDLRQ